MSHCTIKEVDLASKLTGIGGLGVSYTTGGLSGVGGGSS